MGGNSFGRCQQYGKVKTKQLISLETPICNYMMIVGPLGHKILPKRGLLPILMHIYGVCT